MENLQEIIDSVYDICQLDVSTQKKDSQILVAWPPLSRMAQHAVEWTAPKTRPTTLYIHIPFCTGICTYCNYLTKSASENSPEIIAYLNLMAREAALLCKAMQCDRIIVDSIYIGGGTPSLLRSKDLEKLLRVIDQFFTLTPEVEFTLEGCPETLTAAKLSMLQHSRVNRVSIGVETFDDKILASVNRRHDSRQAQHCIEQIQKHGFTDFDIDLINNLPGSSDHTVIGDCDIVDRLCVPSVTLYHYHVKPKSIDFKKTPKDQYLEIKRREIDLHRSYRSRLGQIYDEYMIDWYSRDGLRFRHQILKWQHDANQLTLGIGCYGYYEGIQYRVHSNVKAHEAAINDGVLPVAHSHVLTSRELQNRKYLFNLRQHRLIPSEINDTCEIQLNKLWDLGLLERTYNNTYTISDTGVLYFDDIQRWLADSLEICSTI